MRGVKSDYTKQVVIRMMPSQYARWQKMVKKMKYLQVELLREAVETFLVKRGF